ncbi:hypothetical protein Tco_1235067 [Tanacetum coccineum]
MNLNNFVVKDDMIDYVLHKYGSKWQVHDAIVDDILDDLLKREWEKHQRVKLFAICVDDKRKVTQMKIRDLLEKRIEKVGQHLNKEKQIMDINKGKEKTVMKKRILEEEPLNKDRRSNKPKRSRQKSWERWSTLGEPSGKWDYYVKYDAPPDTTPIEEIAATGWGDEFSDDEITPGKVTILEERSDWDDDERTGGKVLVIQERLAQNQQEYLE